MKLERKQADQHTQVVKFLEESNNIENVWDQDSLEQAIRAWDFIINKDQLSIEAILQTHKILMTGKLNPQNVGTFRTHSIWIGTREGKPWFILSKLMEEWTKSINETVINTLNDKDLIKKQHVDFEIIHPFADGNGRIGRILMNWTFTKVDLPILIVKEREKQQYYQWFLSN